MERKWDGGAGYIVGAEQGTMEGSVFLEEYGLVLTRDVLGILKAGSGCFGIFEKRSGPSGRESENRSAFCSRAWNGALKVEVRKGVSYKRGEVDL